MEKLEPYGMGYPEPKILIKKVSSVYSKIIGKNKTHLSCTLEDIYGYRIDAMIFNFEKSILRVIEEKREFDVVGKVSLNVWENKKNPQFLNYCPAVLEYEEKFLKYCFNKKIFNYVG